MFNFVKDSSDLGKISMKASVGDFQTIQKVRKDLIGEIEAIIEYDDHIHSSSDVVAKRTWEHIKNEELHHVGELLALLNYLDSTQSAHVKKGFEEFESNVN